MLLLEMIRTLITLLRPMFLLEMIRTLRTLLRSMFLLKIIRTLRTFPMQLLPSLAGVAAAQLSITVTLEKTGSSFLRLQLWDMVSDILPNHVEI
ncbi:hypothetical protein V6N11_070557 [Hibiscus sabdariffa]|uniref:Uncharacterized protein n=1 Tax=Hibiscus sabdariffa TaxID=183260 RepID=A0ABR2QFT3_9ROSI